MKTEIDPLTEMVARKLCEFDHLDPNAPVMHGFKTMTALESRLPRAQELVQFIRDAERDDVVAFLNYSQSPHSRDYYANRYADLIAANVHRRDQ